MRVSSRVVGIVALSACISPRAYAPIYGTYPGLRSLIQQSEIIAAVTILDHLPEWDIGGSDRYKIEFTKVLKGSPPQKQALAWLRHLEITGPVAVTSQPGSGPIHYFAPTEHNGLFRSGYRYLLFLVKSERNDGTPYENVNCEGSSFPISPLRDLDSLKVESLADTLILLFREYVDFKRSELQHFEQELDAFIHKGNK
jgi:hypothetical protein